MVAQLELTRGQELGHKIRTARRHIGFTQQRLADELGVHVVMVQKWEASKHVPQMQYRRMLWDLLGLTPEDFDTDPPPDGSKPNVVLPSELDTEARAGVEAELRHIQEGTTDETARAIVSAVAVMLGLALVAVGASAEDQQRALYAARALLDTATVHDPALEQARRILDAEVKKMAA